MGRGGSDDDGATAVATRRSGSPGRIGPTHRSFVKLRDMLAPDGWRETSFWNYDNVEQTVFTSTNGDQIGIGGVPHRGLLRTHRNVSLLLRYEDDHITVMEEILHPSGTLVRRHECGADIDRAVEAFGASIDELRRLEIGTIAEVQYELPREWLASLIADRFRRAAKNAVKAEIRERQRQVELEAQTDIDELAAQMMAEAGFEPETLVGQPA